MKIIVLVSLAVAIALASAVPQPKVDTEWWKTAVFYQVYPRSFKDADNSGEGDLKGIIEKIDHFVDAGVTAIWLSPIYMSPQVDSGYDISNFRDIDPRYGTHKDFEDLVVAVKEKGLKLVMDFVPNHSSDQHEWFKQSATGAEGLYKDFYVWQDGKGVNKDQPPNNWLSIWGGSAWTYVAARSQFYLHQFSKQQPDLNYENEKVVTEMTEILKFWIDRGVDGFRIDAIPHLCETGFEDEPSINKPEFDAEDWNSLNHTNTKDQQKTYEQIYKWRKAIDAYATEKGKDTIVLMTEAYTTLPNTMKYYGTAANPGAHFSFNFQLITGANKDNKAKGIVDEVNAWMGEMPAGSVANWVIGNHDNHRVATRFGTANVDGMNMVVMSLPGVGVTYNGEEIGMENGVVTWAQCQDPSVCPKPDQPDQRSEDDFEELGRDFERTPFHWDKTTNAGFNTGKETWLPVSEKYITNNLVDQKGVPKSHFTIYQALTKEIRPKLKSLNECVAKTYNEDVVLIERTSAEVDYAIILAFNAGENDHTVNLQNTFDLEEEMTVLLSSGSSDYEMNVKGKTNEIKLKASDGVIFLAYRNGATAAQMSLLLLGLVALLKMFV